MLTILFLFITNEGEIKERGLMVKEIYDLPLGDKVVIPFDGNQPSVTNVDGLLRGVLGRLAANSKMFPICFNNWHFGLNNYKNRAWNNVIKVNSTYFIVTFIYCHKELLLLLLTNIKLWWDPIYETTTKVYMMKDIGKKWKENRLKLFYTYYDDKKSYDENVNNPQLSIPEIE